MSAVPEEPSDRQREIIDEISATLPDRVTGEWVSLVFTDRSLSMYGQGTMRVERPDGMWDSALPPRSSDDLLEELRELMYRPGVGTWFSATWTVTRDAAGQTSVDVSFNYDEEPEWTRPIDPGLYSIDLEDFPRDDEHIPG